MELEPNPSMLIRSASEGNYEELCEILNFVNFDTSSINQALLQAVNKSQSASDHLRCVEHLLTQGNPNFKDPSGVSLLMIASKLGQIQLAELLIANSSLVDDRDKEMRTPLMYAVDSGYGDNVDVVKSLLRNKAKVNDQDIHGNSPLHKAAERGYFDSMQVLIEYGAFVNSENKEKNTPLHLASKFGFENCIDLLISKKANCSALNSLGKTPKDLSPEHALYLFEKKKESENSDSSYCSMSSHNEFSCKGCKKNCNEGYCRLCYEANTQSFYESKKNFTENLREITELKQSNFELAKRVKSQSGQLDQLKKAIQEKDSEIKKRDSELLCQSKLLDQQEQDLKNYSEKINEFKDEIESLKEHLLNSRSEVKLHRNESENLRKRLDEFSQKETENFNSPSKLKRGLNKVSYIKQFQKTEKPNQIAQLREEISLFMREVDRWQEEVEPIYVELTAKVRRIIKKEFPQTEVEIYGSFATKLHLPSSDIDMVVMGLEGDKREFLQSLERSLKTHHFIKMTNLIKATVPVIKIKAEMLNRAIFIDITVNDAGHTGLKCLAVVNRLLSQNPMTRSVFLILKQLLYVCNFKEPYNGGLGSYSLFLMVSSFLQKRTDLLEKKAEQYTLAECLSDILPFYVNQSTYLSPIITKDILSGPPYINREPYENYISLVIIDPLNSTNNVAFKTNLPKLIHIFTIAEYNLKRFCLCDCALSNSPLYRMIYETKEHIKN